MEEFAPRHRNRFGCLRSRSGRWLLGDAAEFADGKCYGSRHRAELSMDEAANAAGIPAAVLRDAQSERPVPPDAAAVIETLIAQLAMS